MTVRDADRHASFLSSIERKHTQTVNVGVNDLIIVFTEKCYKCRYILTQFLIWRNNINSPAQTFYLIPQKLCMSRISIYDKIKLYF